MTNQDPENIQTDAQDLAELLEVGMVDFFANRFKQLLTKPGSNLGELTSVINECLSRDNQKLPRLEMSECPGLPARVDVVTKGRFVGPGWPVRHTIVIDTH